MRGEFATWVDRYLDHLLDAYDHDTPTILADNARALELGDPGQLPPSALPLFKIDLEGTRVNPEWANRMIQSSYAATFRVIREMLAVKTLDGGADHRGSRAL